MDASPSVVTNVTSSGDVGSEGGWGGVQGAGGKSILYSVLL